jgi:hypothetical protein
MKTMLKLSAVAAAAGLLAGCETTGLSPRESSGVSYPNYIFGLQTRLTNSPVHPPMTPIRLAVAQVGEPAPSSALLDQLTARHALIAGASGLPLPADAGNSNWQNRGNTVSADYAGRIKTLCRLAQAGGADYVFLFGGEIDTWRKNNSFSILDLTLIGGTVVPGGRINLEGKGAGVLIDAATGEPVFFVNADVKRSAVSPDFLAEGKTHSLRAEARDALVEKLGVQLLDRLAGITNQTTAINAK